MSIWDQTCERTMVGWLQCLGGPTKRGSPGVGQTLTPPSPTPRFFTRAAGMLTLSPARLTTRPREPMGGAPGACMREAGPALPPPAAAMRWRRMRAGRYSRMLRVWVPCIKTGRAGAAAGQLNA